jgi:dynein heavy chain 1
LARPIVFSNWLSKDTQSVEIGSLRSHTKARLRQYSEEELDTKLVLFDSVLMLATARDRVLRQRQGHLLLIGVSGSGRTTIARFVAWMNGLSTFSISTSRKYSMADFDEDLRVVLKRTGCQGEKVSFIIDESQIKDPAFLERMNTLLANSEVPGLFEGDEYSSLITACKEGSTRDGLLLDSNEELLNWFSSEISKNLHVVFLMNPVGDGMGSRAAASPALFNRCVLLFCFG